MKVWIGYQCHYAYDNDLREVEKVFDDEVKAVCWQKEFNRTEFEWREIEEKEVE